MARINIDDLSVNREMDQDEAKGIFGGVIVLEYLVLGTVVDTREGDSYDGAQNTRDAAYSGRTDSTLT